MFVYTESKPNSSLPIALPRCEQQSAYLRLDLRPLASGLSAELLDNLSLMRLLKEAARLIIEASPGRQRMSQRCDGRSSAWDLPAALGVVRPLLRSDASCGLMFGLCPDCLSHSHGTKAAVLQMLRERLVPPQALQSRASQKASAMSHIQPLLRLSRCTVRLARRGTASPW
jgi:hypothetical protein